MKDLVDADEGSKAIAKSTLATAPKDRDDGVFSIAFIASDTQEDNPSDREIMPKTSTSDKPVDCSIV